MGKREYLFSIPFFYGMIVEKLNTMEGESAMRLHAYRWEDCPLLAEMFFDTVHEVNAKDYSPEQLRAWATGTVDLAAWNSSFLAHHTLVAREGAEVVGFGDMDKTGYLDRLYVHKNYQGRGIASALVKELEQWAAAQGADEVTTHASITAKPFFERCGYTLVGENAVVRQGVSLTNFTMKKVF